MHDRLNSPSLKLASAMRFVGEQGESSKRAHLACMSSAAQTALRSFAGFPLWRQAARRDGPAGQPLLPPVPRMRGGEQPYVAAQESAPPWQDPRKGAPRTRRRCLTHCPSQHRPHMSSACPFSSNR
eukprot:1964085-Pleurochrysis_carterae.AAC.2